MSAQRRKRKRQRHARLAARNELEQADDFDESAEQDTLLDSYDFESLDNDGYDEAFVLPECQLAPKQYQ